MKDFILDDSVIFKNARFVLMDLAEAKPGQQIVAIADGDCLDSARALCRAAKSEGIASFIIDIDHYGGRENYACLPIMEPLRQAILHSDMAFMLTDQMKTDFRRFLGTTDDMDASLLGHNKRFTFEANGMDRWELDKERIFTDRRRSLRVYDWLCKAKTVRITTARGTDITCLAGDKPDGMYPVMAILPFYAEVAIVPALGTVNGTVYADGASEFAYGQRGFPIRPGIPGSMELYKQPLMLSFRDSVLTQYDGDPVQCGRLRKLLEEVSPRPDLCDEVGLVMCTSAENDKYGWRVDGSHQTRCVHVALGNIRRRKEIIHSTEHIDFDIHDPVISIDGTVIYENGVFLDDIIFSR